VKRSAWRRGRAARTSCAGSFHVVQQLRFHAATHSDFFLGPPKSGSSGTVEVDGYVATRLAEHIRQFPPAVVTLPDVSDGEPDTGKEPTRRPVELLFALESGRPIDDKRWAEMWAGWRTAAGWRTEGTFHSLRHFFATTLITKGVDPQEVQKALRHARPRTTLDSAGPPRDRQLGYPDRMEPERTSSGAQTRALLAEQGIYVTEEGLARARRKLREAEERMTPEARAELRAIFGLNEPAA